MIREGLKVDVNARVLEDEHEIKETAEARRLKRIADSVDSSVIDW